MVNNRLLCEPCWQDSIRDAGRTRDFEPERPSVTVRACPKCNGNPNLCGCEPTAGPSDYVSQRDAAARSFANEQRALALTENKIKGRTQSKSAVANKAFRAGSDHEHERAKVWLCHACGEAIANDKGMDLIGGKLQAEIDRLTAEIARLHEKYDLQVLVKRNNELEVENAEAKDACRHASALIDATNKERDELRARLDEINSDGAALLSEARELRKERDAARAIAEKLAAAIERAKRGDSQWCELWDALAEYEESKK